MEQRTAEWFAARAGRVTASRIADVTGKTKSGYGAARADYMVELLAERLTGQPTEKFVSSAMQWGTDQEPHARHLYTVKTGLWVDEVGFVRHPKIEWAGASPDGRIGIDGLVEIKCPKTTTHLETLTSKSVPKNHYAQMQWQMSCTTASWCDYVSYDPRLPENLQLFVARVPRSEETIMELEAEVVKFLRELDAMILDLNNRFPAEQRNVEHNKREVQNSGETMGGSGRSGELT